VIYETELLTVTLCDLENSFSYRTSLQGQCFEKQIQHMSPMKLIATIA